MSAFRVLTALAFAAAASAAGPDVLTGRPAGVELVDHPRHGRPRCCTSSRAAATCA